MLFQIAWRNIWRNPLRSGIVMFAIALGLWAGIFIFAFSFGMMESRTRDILETQISHIQFHDPEFEREDPGAAFLDEGDQLLERVATDPQTEKATARFLANAILNSTRGRKGTYPVQIIGINPEREAAVTSLQDRIVAGEYFQDPGRRVPEISIGKKLAENIGVLSIDSSGNEVYDFSRKITLSNIVLPNGGHAAIRVKVSSIYRAQNSNLEGLQVFINKEDLRQKLGIGEHIHAIAVLLKNGKEISQAEKKDYQKDYQDSLRVSVSFPSDQGQLQLLQGKFLSEEAQWKSEALVSHSLAERMGIPEADSSQRLMLNEGISYKISDFKLKEGKSYEFQIDVVGIVAGDSPRVYLPERNYYFEAEVLETLGGSLSPKEKQEVEEYPGSVKADLLAQEVNVKSWSDIAPEIELIDSQFSSSMRIMIIVILLALGFGIVNTMLMAILERTRELGMLMSIGMNRAKVFLMIMLETIMLTFIGAPLGILLAWLTIILTGKTGIDLSGFEAGASEFGMSTMVFPSLPANYYLEVAILVIIAGILASIYPALRATRLKPAEAVRTL